MADLRRHMRLQRRLSASSRSAKPRLLVVTALCVSVFLVPITVSSSRSDCPDSDLPCRMVKGDCNNPSPASCCWSGDPGAVKQKEQYEICQSLAECKPKCKCQSSPGCDKPPRHDAPNNPANCYCTPAPQSPVPRRPPVPPSSKPLPPKSPLMLPPPTWSTQQPPPPFPPSFRPPPPPYPPFSPPPPGKNRTTVAERVGWSFLSFALLLQVALAGFLAYKRLELQRLGTPVD